MKIDPNSSFWINNSYDEVKTILEMYERRMVDELIECQLHLNAYNSKTGDKKNLYWWVGSRDRILTEIWYVKVAYGVTFDKVIAVSENLPKYEDMSEYCQKIWMKLNN